jgi:hypothetical protein
MSQEMPEQTTGETTMLLALLMSGVRETEGGQAGYAHNLGVSKTSLVGWLNHNVNPLHKVASRDKLTSNLGLRADELETLGEVSVQEACEIVLQAKAAEDPKEQNLRNRFFSLMVEHGSAIPSAAFLIYMTADQANREQLVSLLETQGVAAQEPVSESTLLGTDALQ